MSRVDWTYFACVSAKTQLFSLVDFEHIDVDLVELSLLLDITLGSYLIEFAKALKQHLLADKSRFSVND